jgi:hypothetical protein
MAGSEKPGSRGVEDRELTPLYARLLVHLIRPFPNFDLFFIKSLREKAVQCLQLKPGDRALNYEPWALLKNHLDEFKVEEYFFGWMFLAWGSVDHDRSS